MRPFSRFKAGIAALLCMSVLFSQSLLAVSVDDLQQQADSLEDEKNEISTQIDETDKLIAEKEEELAQINAQVSQVESEIDSLNNTIYACTEKISELEGNIEQKQEEIEDDYERLRQRVRTIYMSGGTSDLEVLLGAKTFDEFIDASALVKAVSKYDKKLIDGLKDAITEINSELAQVEQQQEELVEARQDMEATRADLDALQEEADAAAQELKELKGDLSDELESVTEEQEALYSQIEEMIRQQQEEEERLKQEQEANDNSSGSSGSGSSGDSGGSGYSTPGSTSQSGYPTYIWPAPSCTIITSYWGDSRGHQGLDLACYGSAYGKEIIAAASGTVTIANSTDSWGSGWGYYVMINHGNGYSTLYAHCSQVLVSAGQYVEAGQLIAYIGNTGNSYGAHLHFECWYNSTRYNPAVHFNI